MNTTTINWIFGITFVLVGIIGFFPNPLVAPDGVFAVNAAHNMVHVLTGSAFIYGALKFADRGGIVLKVIGAAYAVVAVLGFFVADGGMLLGLVHINQADKWLHVFLAAGILGAGFIFSDRKVAVRLPAKESTNETS